ncbi:MAG: molybdopterin cofactor-binding domain-containing protein [Pseudomonadota bacterium]
MNRRELLKATGWSAAGLTIFTTSGCGLLPALPTFGKSSEEDALSWIKVDNDGQISFLLPRAEIGQGIDTGLTLIVAEELQTQPEQIHCQYQRTDQMAPCQMTVGSQSIENYGRLTALVSAGLRQELLKRASEKLKCPMSELICQDGQIVGADKALSFRELVTNNEETVFAASTSEELELYSSRDQTSYVGKPTKALHQNRIVTGQEMYSRDIVLPNMLFGEIARPPQLTARLVDAKPKQALSVPGVVRVIQGPNKELGIVAESPMAASEGLAAMKCKWEVLTDADVWNIDRPIDIDKAIAEDLLDHKTIDKGDIAQGKQRSITSLNLRYDTPMAAHAPMEPRAGVASNTASGLEIWTGSQDPWYVRAAVSKAVKIDPDNIIVHNCRAGGAFGGRIHCQASFEAAWLCHNVQRPVKVQWSREDEFKYNYVGPQFSTRIEAGVDARGNISHWHHQMAGAPILTSSMLIPPALHWLANLPADPGTVRGTDLPYNLSNQLTETADIRIPMPTGAWRGLGAAPNTFAVECAMDELAEAADIHPIEFRRRHASSDRLKQVLARLSELTKHETNVGIAATAYKGVTFVGIAAKVERKGSKANISKIWCVHDCGKMIAPDRVRAQVEGNLIWGVSMAMLESFGLKHGIARTTNFDSYAIARQIDLPELSIELMASSEPPSGAAEAALAPAAAAIANAFSRFSGDRIRTLPIGTNG